MSPEFMVRLMPNNILILRCQSTSLYDVQNTRFLQSELESCNQILKTRTQLLSIDAAGPCP